MEKGGVTIMPKEFINVYGRIVRDDCTDKEKCQIGSCNDCVKTRGQFPFTPEQQVPIRGIDETTTAEILVRLHNDNIAAFEMAAFALQTTLEGLRATYVGTHFADVFEAIQDDIAADINEGISVEQELIEQTERIDRVSAREMHDGEHDCSQCPARHICGENQNLSEDDGYNDSNDEGDDD